MCENTEFLLILYSSCYHKLLLGKLYFDILLVQYPISLVWSVTKGHQHIYLDKHAKDDVILCGKVGDRSLTNPTPTAGTVQHLTVACLCVGA